MAINNNTVYLGYGQEKVTTTTSLGRALGTRGETPDGRVFYWSFSGEAIGAGQLTMQKAGVANHDMDQATQAAAAIGDTSIAMTTAGTDVTIDQYGDGYIYINDGPGEGHIYRIASPGTGGTAGRAHPARSGAGTLVLQLAGGETVREALTTADSLVGLMENPYKDVEIWDANDIDGPALGVAPTEIDDNTYFWNQTFGPCNVLMDNTTFVLGSGVEGSTATDGAVTLHDVSGNSDRKLLGVVQLIVAASTDYGLVDLSIRA